MLLSITKNSALLGAFAIICTGAVAIVNVMTKPIIAEQQQKALLKTVDQLIKKDTYDNDLFASCFTVENDKLLGKDRKQKVFLAKQQDNDVALMIEASTFKGYTGEIKIAIAILKDGTLAGVRVLDHAETPGLGDKIQTNKSDWVFSFTGKSYQENNKQIWDVTKNGGDFDAFTGATITPRAVTFAVRDALIYFKMHKAFLFDHAPTCEAK